MKGLNPQLFDQAQTLQPNFVDAHPFEHIVIDDFLDPELCESLLQQFPAFDEKLAMNENGEIGGKAVHEKVRSLGDAFEQIDSLASSEGFRQWVSELTAIPELQYDEFYFGGGTHENLHGQGLDPHVDFTHHPMTGEYRRLNLIVYLNKEWDSSWGGNIELHRNPRSRPEEDEIISVEPKFNRAVIFATHHTSWHGFPPINIPQEKQDISRKSFALYYYTKDRPEWFDKPHSTIYVDRHIGSELQPGHTLTEADFNEMRRLYATRDQHLERLYKIISNQTKEIDDLKKAVQMRLPGPVKKWAWGLRRLKSMFK